MQVFFAVFFVAMGVGGARVRSISGARGYGEAHIVGREGVRGGSWARKIGSSWAHRMGS